MLSIQFGLLKTFKFQRKIYAIIVLHHFQLKLILILSYFSSCQFDLYNKITICILFYEIHLILFLPSILKNVKI
jgi:hypothetical protein